MYLHNKTDKEDLDTDLKQFATDFAGTWESRTASENWEFFKSELKIIKSVPTKKLRAVGICLG